MNAVKHARTFLDIAHLLVETKYPDTQGECNRELPQLNGNTLPVIVLTSDASNIQDLGHRK